VLSLSKHEWTLGLRQAQAERWLGLIRAGSIAEELADRSPQDVATSSENSSKARSHRMAAGVFYFPLVKAGLPAFSMNTEGGAD
jgi:hypothetical protein